MSDIKCPFCQQELEKYYWDDLECYACPDLTCEGFYMTATKDMWQELIRTRKALDVAVDILKEIDKTRCTVDANLYAVNHKLLNAGNVFCWTTPDEIHNALDQTTLEQKD